MSRLDPPKLPGTKVKNRVLITSLGTESLDGLFGGGAPNTSLVFMDEPNGSRKFFQPIARCFLAEGIVEGQTTVCASSTLFELEKLLENMPKHCEEPSVIYLETKTAANEKDPDFRIAWRYNTMPKIDSSVHSTSKSNIKFDLSKNWSLNIEELKRDERLFVISPSEFPPTFADLWRRLHKLIRRDEFLSESSLPLAQRKFLRLLITDISSPIWTDSKRLIIFLTHLKAFCRKVNCLVLIGLNSSILRLNELDDILRLADTFISLDFVSEEEQKRMSLHQKFDGRLLIRKLPAVFSAASYRPDCLDLIFSLKRTHFNIEIFHLPPAIDGVADGDAQKSGAKTANCQRVQEEF